MAPKTAKQAARNLTRYEVSEVPEIRIDTSTDVLLQRLLNNRGKSFLLLEKPIRKKSSCTGLVTRLRRRAAEVGIAHLILVVSRASWVEGRVRVFGRALTDEEAALTSSERENEHDRDERDGDADGRREGGEGGEGGQGQG